VLELIFRFVFNWLRLSVKKKAAEKPKPVKRGKAAKDPNKPKRPPSAFFVFM
jgi:high mobility group protein B3